MQGTWLEMLRDRIRSTWDVLTGRAYAAYSMPDHMGEVRLRAALIQMQERDERNGSLPPAYRAIVEDALSPAPESRSRSDG